MTRSAPPKTLRRRLVSASTIVVAALGATVLTPVAAHADALGTVTLDPAKEVAGAYTFALNTTSGSFIQDEIWGQIAANQPTQLNISTGCPVGYRKSSRTYWVGPDGTYQDAAIDRMNPNAADWGLQGNPIKLFDDYAVVWTALGPNVMANGLNKLIVTCDAVATLNEEGLKPGTDYKYFVTTIKVDRTAKTWQVVSDTTPPVEKTATTTAVTTSAVTGTSATLTAKVDPADATGTVQFTQNGTNVGTPVPVTGGQAITSVSGLTPATAYTFGAVYSGDATHQGSTGAAAPVTTEPPAPVADSSKSDVSVSVPAETGGAPTGLSISVKPGAVTLSGAATRDKGADWQATGSLGGLTVKDDRQVAGAAWSLTGSASDFVGGGNTIGVSNFGWEPAKVSGAGTVGDPVAPGVNNGLGWPKPLAQGVGTKDANVLTALTAGLTLKVPGGTPAGNYSSVLSLTLI
ncbi:Ig-like domain-containing protein [Raineyella sp. W15-4]|uniref:Ig-like domain-containing protein n=1 Tax=Raineyella sp. W15-4 TaxID=3081651 RepID=UPI002955B150|nr:Ig-like domain-containing protein [Raineyella sp. W15-4]WOQ18181.1 Ig-like domain-containing protein [Raineyella sp. W15-4]